MVLKFLKIVSPIIFLFLINSCYHEYVVIPVGEKNVFNLILTPNAEAEILDARNRKFDIEPTPFLYYGELEYELDNAKVRGRSATNFQRKSFAINLVDFLVLNDYSGRYREFEKFKLVAMCQDYTYLENRLAHSFLRSLNLWPLHSFYTEVMLNNKHQGLYLFIEDPEQNCFHLNNAEVVIRRYYQGEIDKLEVNSDLATKDSMEYFHLFRSIYELLPDYTGEELYFQLSKKMNLQNYMRKIAFDYLVKNGDYNDEIYFYGKSQNDGTFYFDLIPWDYDDLFSSQPHEIWRDWAVGNMLGVRTYNNMDDVLAVVGDRLIFSIEDDIDFLIATDDFLYQKYLNEVNYVLSVLTPVKIDEVLTTIHEELIPFYNKPEIIEQSKFDADSTSLELLEQNILNKSEFLKKRVLYLQAELERQMIDQ